MEFSIIQNDVMCIAYIYKVVCHNINHCFNTQSHRDKYTYSNACSQILVGVQTALESKRYSLVKCSTFSPYHQLFIHFLL